MTAEPSPTVLTLAGLLKSYNLDNFGGVYRQYPIKKVNYPNTLALPGNARRGVEELDRMIKTTPGRIIVVGHSMGAQVEYAWIRRYHRPEVDPARLTFISSGNPERRFNGVSVLEPRKRPAVYDLGVGIPADTPYHVVDIARQYDYWADYPNRPEREAINNLSSAIHSRYDEVNLADERNARVQFGNVTYVTAYTDVAPAADKWYYPRSKKITKDRELRPKIEAAYDRPEPFAA